MTECDLPHGALFGRLHDKELHNEIRTAEIVRGVTAQTGADAGVFYGIARLRRIVRRQTGEAAKVLKIPIDPETDDPEVLVALVKTIKGACCHQDENQ